MAGPALLALDAVSMLRRDNEGKEKAILDQVSLEIGPSSIIALIGPSGSGKSTLLRLLNRLEDPSNGTILFQGQNLKHLDPLQLRRQVGLVLQKPFMFPATVLQNLQYPFTARGEELPADEQLAAAMRICDVDKDWLPEPARKLSVGQQQRVNIARTLLNRPKLLLLDEPTSSLDPDTADLVISRLARTASSENMALLIVTHDHALARKHADRTLALANGQLGDVEGGG